MLEPDIFDLDHGLISETGRNDTAGVLTCAYTNGSCKMCKCTTFSFMPAQIEFVACVARATWGNFVMFSYNFRVYCLSPRTFVQLVSMVAGKRRAKYMVTPWRTTSWESSSERPPISAAKTHKRNGPASGDVPLQVRLHHAPAFQLQGCHRVGWAHRGGIAARARASWAQ